MAISPPGDIILDVVRAAEPASVEAAQSRLKAMAGASGAETPFQVATAEATREPVSRKSGKADSFQKFEALVLQTFLKSMLPADTSSVYGQGLSGEMWQSMLAEQLGETMAKRGGIGIADRVLRDHYKNGEVKVPLQGVSHDPAKPEIDKQKMLSAARVQEIQREMARSLNEDMAAPANGPRG
ncbi:rod-binding protein [Aquamicrobium sp. LC103]|uniref:rod-binding protein n=1 Tax=Aquamicrobium sp. LC103 TaxID=1120658 RepID=UPI00063EB9C6|nr:rod-binding protein [Aquamicrobium sp. LC103]TKT77508.1 flagellar biosynthesis protein FlgJ [Aquamicrobium sp. LC103]